MTHIPQITVGIPAYNEESNIRELLRSILAQRAKRYRLHAIHVVCDGCTDNTVAYAKSIAQEDQRVIVHERKKRSGKANALNFIFRKFHEDYLVITDADTLWNDRFSFEKMLGAFTASKQLRLVSPLNVAVLPDTIMGKFAYVSYRSFQDAYLKLNNGNNFYSSMAAHMIAGSLVRSFRFPKGTIADQLYLHAKAVEHTPRAYRLIKSASVLFRPVDSFADWRISGVRSVAGDRASLYSFFDQTKINDYTMPKSLLLVSTLRWFMKHPFWTVGSVIMNIYIRSFPLKVKIVKNGIWKTTVTAKKQILNVSK